MLLHPPTVLEFVEQQHDAGHRWEVDRSSELYGEDDGVNYTVNNSRVGFTKASFLDYYLGSDKEGGRKKECSLVSKSWWCGQNPG